MEQNALSLAQIIGYCAMCLSVSSFAFKCNRTTNKILTVTNFFWTLHFILLGAWAGSLNLGISTLRSLIFVIDNKKRNTNYFIIFMILYTVLGIIFIKQPKNILPLLASYSACFAVYIFNGVKAKLGFMLANLCLFIYSYFVFSIGGMISMAAGILVGAFTVWRMANTNLVQNK